MNVPPLISVINKLLCFTTCTVSRFSASDAKLAAQVVRRHIHVKSVSHNGVVSKHCRHTTAISDTNPPLQEHGKHFNRATWSAVMLENLTVVSALEMETTSPYETLETAVETSVTKHKTTDHVVTTFRTSNLILTAAQLVKKYPSLILS
jgi:hypothetical protein